MKIPAFIRGQTNAINNAIEQGIIKYPSYVYNIDLEQFGFLDKDEELHYIKGNNKKQILTLEELPDVESGDEDILYIVNNVIYTFDGTSYIPSYQNLTPIIENLSSQITQNSSDIGNLQDELFITNNNIALLNSDLNNSKEIIEALDNDKANKANTLNGYGITDGYTKSEVDLEIANSIENLNQNIDNLYAPDILNIKNTLTKLENTGQTVGSIRNIIQNYLELLNASNIAVNDSDNNFTSDIKTVETCLAELKTLIDTIGGNVNLNLYEAQTPTVGYLKTYVLTQGENLIGSIDIPKDFLVKSASAGTVVAADKASGGKFENDSNYAIGDTYFDFVINVKEGTASDEHVYINVSTLVDTYTGSGDQATALTTGISINIDSNNVVYATILTLDGSKLDAGSVAKTALASDVQASLEKADTAIQLSDMIASNITYSSTQNVAFVIDQLETEINSIDAKIGFTPTGQETFKDYVDSKTGNVISSTVNSAVIAINNNDIITIKAGITQENGAIANNSDNDITLAKVAATGAANDVSLADTGNYFFNNSTVETALQQIMPHLCWQELT